MSFYHICMYLTAMAFSDVLMQSVSIVILKYPAQSIFIMKKETIYVCAPQVPAYTSYNSLVASLVSTHLSNPNSGVPMYMIPLM